MQEEERRFERSSGTRRAALKCFFVLSLLVAFNAKIGIELLPGGTRRKSGTVAEHILKELKGKQDQKQQTTEHEILSEMQD